MSEASPKLVDPLAEYDYALPPECIAQHPPERRSEARLLVLDRQDPGRHRHVQIDALPRLLRPGDLLVRNATRVVPARLLGRKATGGRAEALLLGPEPACSLPGRRTFRALVRCRGRLRPGLALCFDGAATSAPLDAEIVDVGDAGEVLLAFASDADPYAWGEAPLPPYIRRDPDQRADFGEDRERYQTVFARVPGAVAAPTAGLHFTPELFDAHAAAGIHVAEVVLHTGAGTFRPIAPADLERGRLHAERFELPEATAQAIERARQRGGRVIAVGTTSTRVLEACALPDGRVQPARGETDLLLAPGSRFQVIDGLITNFHLPRSSLLLLVAAFAGRDTVLAAYREAIARGYRFYSYGDAMLVS